MSTPKKKQPKVTGKRERPRARIVIQKAKEQWYRLTAFFDGKSQQVLRVNEEDVLLAGWVPPDNDVCICLVPPSVSNEQGVALQKILEANFRHSVLVLTNTTQLVRLKPISDVTANQILGKAKNVPPSVLQFASEPLNAPVDAAPPENEGGQTDE